MTLHQTDLFGGNTPTGRKILPHELPKPINDWALSLFIVLNHPKGVTVFSAMKDYGMVKFQERLNEILKENPDLVTKKMIQVPKRLGRIVDVMQYKIADYDKAIELYAVINKKGGSKSLNISK